MDTVATLAVGDSSNTHDQETLYSSESEESIDSSDDSTSPSLSQKRKAHSSGQTRIRTGEGETQQVALSVDDAEQIVQQLKKFSCTTSRSEKLRILTVLPKSWSIKLLKVRLVRYFSSLSRENDEKVSKPHKPAKVFGVSRYFAR